MRLLIFFITLLISYTADAGCSDLLTYRDDRIFINISDGGCSSVGLKITSIPIKNGEKLFNLKQVLEFEEECKYSENGKFLSCRVNNRNPLSGTTYQRVQKGFEKCDNFTPDGENPKYPAFVFRCVKGCQGVPREIPESYGCD